MKTASSNTMYKFLLAGAAAATLLAAPAAAQPVTVQGVLSSSGQGQNGAFDFETRLFDVPFGGAPLTPTETDADVLVTDGKFQFNVDSFFDIAYQIDFQGGGAVWAEVRVRRSGSNDPFETLDPRLPITPAPSAQTAGGSAGDFLMPNPGTAIRFGPTGECTIGIDPDFTGLVERDPTGFRLLGRDNQGCRLLFGPTDDCTIEVDPQGPPGLLLRDPNCIRLLSPIPSLPPVLYWGPTNDCSIGIIPGLPGLAESDPNGFRLLGQDGQGCRLLFGPTQDCTIEIDPLGPPGLLLRDPAVRILPPPDPTGIPLPPQLLFGPTDECRIELPVPGQGLPGLRLYDPFGIRICSPDPSLPPILRFGDTDDCTIGLEPGLTGLVERDPTGFRLLGQNNQGCRLLFGPTDDCTIEIDPFGPAGLLLRDPFGVRVLGLPESSPGAGDGAPPLLTFGPTDECRIFVDPQVGMVHSDPRGFFFETQAVTQFGGPVVAPEFIQTSSARHKNNIQTIDRALDIVTNLRGVSFDWNDNINGGKHDIGFVAEEVVEIVPEVVRVTDGQADGVAYHRVTALTVEAIKAQQQQIDLLKAEIDLLKAELAERK